MKHRICFLIPQFGVLPNYIHYFIHSASYRNSTIDFYFFTDQKIKFSKFIQNVFVVNLTFKAFNELACKKLNHSFVIHNAYKLCDLKPMYGLILEDYIKSYSHWGYCDYDIILGDVEKMLSINNFIDYEIFCVQQSYASGPFQIYKNEKKCNELFKKSSSWKTVLNEKSNQLFDEAGDVIREIWKGKDIKECKGKIISMTHLLKDEALMESLKIKVHMKELIKEDFQDNTGLTFKQGKLVSSKTQNEIYIYHFMNRKNRILFNDHLFSKEINQFQFTRYGFTLSNNFALGMGLILSFIKRLEIRALRKLRTMIYN